MPDFRVRPSYFEDHIGVCIKARRDDAQDLGRASLGTCCKTRHQEIHSRLPVCSISRSDSAAGSFTPLLMTASAPTGNVTTRLVPTDNGRLQSGWMALVHTLATRCFVNPCTEAAGKVDHGTRPHCRRLRPVCSPHYLQLMWDPLASGQEARRPIIR